MRLFLLCLPALALVAAGYDGMPMTRYKLPADKQGLPDGTVITFHFKYKAETTVVAKNEGVTINFYYFESVDVDEALDVTAHFLLDRTQTTPVTVSNLVNDKWINSIIKKGTLDMPPHSKGWWRLDVIKHDKYRMSAFFQGYYMGTHTFERPLNNIKSVYIISDFVDHPTLEIPIRLPNQHPATRSVEDFKKIAGVKGPSRKLMSMTNFPKGAHIKMIAVLRTYSGLKPALIFKHKDGTKDMFLKIQQEINQYSGDRHELYIYSKNFPAKFCHGGKLNGELQHLVLARDNAGNIVLTTEHMLGAVGTKREQECTPSITAGDFDKPFDITAEDGALLLHLEHNLPPAAKSKRGDL